MSQVRQTGLVFLNKHREIILNGNKTIDRFASNKKCKDILEWFQKYKLVYYADYDDLFFFTFLTDTNIL